jgi:hypothetical protein
MNESINRTTERKTPKYRNKEKNAQVNAIEINRENLCLLVGHNFLQNRFHNLLQQDSVLNNSFQSNVHGGTI